LGCGRTGIIRCWARGSAWAIARRKMAVEVAAAAMKERRSRAALISPSSGVGPTLCSNLRLAHKSTKGSRSGRSQMGRRLEMLNLLTPDKFVEPLKTI